MRYINIKEAKEGMKLASDLYDSAGRILLGADTTLNAKTLSKINDLGVEGIYIEDSISNGIKIESVISPALKSKGMSCIKNEDVDGCKEVASDIVKQVISKNEISLDLTDLRTFDDYTYSHSVNVAVLASVIGLGLKLPEKDLSNVVLAGLLHDIGKIKIPAAIINKPGRLTHEEYKIIQNHAIYSYEKIKNRMDISAQVKQAVLYHHENIDGSGYPNGVNQSQLSLFARIIHVADVYDALTAKRPYKEPYSPYEAFEYLMGGCGAMFDTTVVTSFLHYVPIYPKGTEVTLSNGQKAIIYDNVGARNMRPIVILTETGEKMDLWEEDNLNITIISTEAHGNSIIDSEKERMEMLNPVKRAKLLVVDKEHGDIEMVKRICTEYDVSSIHSGEGALDYLSKMSFPDAILIEVDLPGMDGVEATRRILEYTNYKVPIAFVTAHRDRDTVLRCRELNPASYILKPYKDMFLKSEIKRIISEGSDLN